MCRLCPLYTAMWRTNVAARLNRRHQETVREKIKASQLINRLQDHILGKIELDTGQIRAIEILLKKSLPDLSAVEHSGEVETKQFVVMGVPEAASAEEWQKKAPSTQK